MVSSQPRNGTGAGNCPICGASDPHEFAGDERFESRRCDSCGYIATNFRAGHVPPVDYYESIMSTDDFVGSVGSVRAAQMERVLNLIAKLGVRSGKLLDIGSGYGWLLRAARARGFTAYGIEPSLPVEDSQVLKGSFPETRFDTERFDVVSAIDVVEHIALPALGEFLRAVRSSLKEPGVFVLKVPDARGLIFAASRWAHRLTCGRCRRPLDRMLQLNYAHLHVSYFTERSLRCVLKRHGFWVIATLRDPEATPGTIWSRITFEDPPRLPLRFAYSATLWALLLLAKIIRRQDALIVVARP